MIPQTVSVSTAGERLALALSLAWMTQQDISAGLQLCANKTANKQTNKQKDSLLNVCVFLTLC